MDFSTYNLTAPQVKALNFFRDSLKSSGIWAKLDLLYVGCVSDEALARTNIVNPGQFYLKPRDGAVHIKGLGWAAHNNGYVETGFNLINDRVNYDQDSASILAACPHSSYQVEGESMDDSVAGTSDAGVGGSYLRITPVGTRTRGRVRINSDTSRDFLAEGDLVAPETPRPVVGLVSRVGQSSFNIYYGSEKVREVSDIDSTEIPNATIWLCRDYQTGGSKKPISIFALGGGLSEEESLNFSRLVEDLYIKLVYPGVGLSEFDCQNIDTPIRTRVFRAAGSPDTSDIIVFQHGNGRNMESANRAGWPIAGRFGKIVVSFEFDASRFSSSDYHRIGLVDSGGSVQPQSEWLPTIMNRCLEEIRDRLGVYGQRQILWGHSAGGQAAHRTSLFAPDSFDAFVAANSGYYTALNEDFDYPFGLQNLPSNMKDSTALQAMLAAPLTIYIGTEDNISYTEDSYVSSDPGAVAQGDNRYERAFYMYNTAQSLASSNGWAFSWSIVEGDGIGHSSRGMGSRANVPVGD